MVAGFVGGADTLWLSKEERARYQVGRSGRQPLTVCQERGAAHLLAHLLQLGQVHCPFH